MPHILAELVDIEDVVATLKIDGTSATYFYDADKGAVRVCSATWKRWRMMAAFIFLVMKKYPQIEDMLRENPEFVLQGNCRSWHPKESLGR